MSKLEEARLVEIDKKFFAKIPNTQVRLTDKGRAAIERHWQQLEELHKNAQQWQAEQSDRLLISNEATS